MTAQPPLDDRRIPSNESESSTTLRGAAVAVDPRRAGQVLAGLCVAVLTVFGVVLLITGANTNAQINSLKTRGTIVAARATTCLGQVAGSGSNPTGYTCRATYRVSGRRYQATLPGTRLAAPGTKVTIVVDRSDPTLISTPGILARQHSTARVFILPITLLVCALGLGFVVLRRHRQRQPARGTGQSVSRSLSDLGDDERLGALGGV